MLTLLTHPGGAGFYSYSMFCTKAAYLLELSGETWQRENFQDLASMPYGKLPVVRDGDLLIADSECIRRYLETRGADFEPGLTAVQKAQARQITRLVDECLWQQLMCARWLDPDGWAHMRAGLFAPLPEEVAQGLRASVLAGLRFTGIARFDKAERLVRLDQDLAALAEGLGDQPYLFGDQITAADCALAPMVEALSRAPADGEVCARVGQHQRLETYAARVAADFDLLALDARRAG